MDPHLLLQALAGGEYVVATQTFFNHVNDKDNKNSCLTQSASNSMQKPMRARASENRSNMKAAALAAIPRRWVAMKQIKLNAPTLTYCLKLATCNKRRLGEG